LVPRSADDGDHGAPMLADVGGYGAPARHTYAP